MQILIWSDLILPLTLSLCHTEGGFDSFAPWQTSRDQAKSIGSHLFMYLVEETSISSGLYIPGIEKMQRNGPLWHLGLCWLCIVTEATVFFTEVVPRKLKSQWPQDKRKSAMTQFQRKWSFLWETEKSLGPLAFLKLKNSNNSAYPASRILVPTSYCTKF